MSKTGLFPITLKTCKQGSISRRKTKDYWNFSENRNFTPRMGTRSTLFRLVSLLVRSILKIDIKYNLEWQTKRGVNESSIFTTRKVDEVKIELWTTFRLKIGPFPLFKLIFFCSKDKRFVDPAFFVVPSCNLCQNLVLTRQLGKKC